MQLNLREYVEVLTAGRKLMSKSIVLMAESLSLISHLSLEMLWVLFFVEMFRAALE